MARFRIVNKVSAADFGVWRGATPREALEAMAAETGGRVVETRPALDDPDWHEAIVPEDWIVEEVP
jgi:hypothetical protein